MMASESDPPVVFIIDNDDGVRKGLVFLLETSGLRAEAYASPDEFLRHYRPSDRTCLLLDHDPVNSAGLEFMRSKTYRRLRLPIIVMSGGGGSHLHQQALDSGAVAYFDKLMSPETLITTLRDAAEGLLSSEAASTAGAGKK